MRRMLLALAVISGFAVLGFVPGAASAQGDGSVAFTIHAASCPSDFEGGFYETCHSNYLEGAAFTLTADGISPAEITSSAEGVGEAMILAGVATADNAVLTVTAPTGGWAYCKDQISGFVLADGPIPDTGAIGLGTLTTTQWVICDVYQYDVVEAAAANG